MENKKQSSVDWLYNTIDDEILNLLDGEIDLNELSIAMLKIKEQAKAMHKEEMKEMYLKGIENYDTTFKRKDNETFGGQDERDRSIQK